jgi:hypothetical protein
MSAIQEEVVVPRLQALVVDDSKLACSIFEPAPADFGCTPGVAPAEAQRVAALAIN